MLGTFVKKKILFKPTCRRLKVRRRREEEEEVKVSFQEEEEENLMSLFDCGAPSHITRYL